MTEIDPAAVERDKAALRGVFSYRDFGHDLELVWADLDRPLLAEASRAGLSLYPAGSEFVLDCYFERGALEPLVKIYSGHPHRVASRFDRLLAHLEAAKRGDLIEKRWTSIARRTRAEYYYQRPRHPGQSNPHLEEFKTYALEAYTQGINWMTRLGHLDVASKLGEDRQALADGRFPSLPPPSDLRRMDDVTFWDVLSQSRSRSESTVEQIVFLEEALRAFQAADIKRFGLLYARYMRKLYHWDVWALAYAARGGCSDGAFEAFRTWLVLQGEPALIDLAIANPGAAAGQVPHLPDLPDGPLTMAIEEAYFLRTGVSLESPLIDLDRPKGREWDEEAFRGTYSELVQHYES